MTVILFVTSYCFFFYILFIILAIFFYLEPTVGCFVGAEVAICAQMGLVRGGG